MKLKTLQKIKLEKEILGQSRDYKKDCQSSYNALFKFLRDIVKEFESDINELYQAHKYFNYGYEVFINRMDQGIFYFNDKEIINVNANNTVMSCYVLNYFIDSLIIELEKVFKLSEVVETLELPPAPAEKLKRKKK